jgi:GTP-binding protein
VLIHLIDATLADVAAAYKTVRAELKAYSPLLAAKPEIVALNKCDALAADEIEAKAKAVKRAARRLPRRVSAATGVGVRELTREAMKAVEAHRVARAPAPKPEPAALPRLTPTPVDARRARARARAG